MLIMSTAQVVRAALLIVIASTRLAATLAAQFAGPICNPPSGSLPPASAVGHSLVAFDHDGDGDQDVFASVNVDFALYGFDQISPGVFAPSVVIPLPFVPDRLLAANLDQGAGVEILATHAAGYAIIRDAGGTAQVTNVADATLGALQLIDLEGDGDLDLWHGALVVALNDGNADFSTVIVISLPSAYAYGPTIARVAGDLDGDGDADFVSLRKTGTQASSMNVFEYVTVLDVSLNDGAGSFRRAQTIIEIGGEDARSLALGDFDGNGSRDLVVEDSPITQTLRFWSSAGGGRFARGATVMSAPPEPQPAFGPLSSTQVADLNGDGADDVVRLLHAGVSSTYWFVLGGSCAPAVFGSLSIPNNLTAIPRLLHVMGSAGPDLVSLANDLVGGGYMVCVRENVMPYGPATSALTLTTVSGDGQAARFGDTYAQPLVVEVRNASGQTVAGQPVAFFAMSGVTSAASAVTDAQGRAQVTATAGAAGGQVMIVAFAATACARFHLQEVGLRVRSLPLQNFKQVAIQYFHDAAGVPLIVAADSPLAAPGFVSTTYGDLYTSILNPSPPFVALDGLGTFGPSDPTVITTPDWSAVIPLPSAFVPPGAVKVFQVYGLDPALPFPQNVLVSNPQTVAF
jgi:hypothetical protein